MFKNLYLWLVLACASWSMGSVVGLSAPLPPDGTLPDALPSNANFMARHLRVLQLEQFNRFNYMDSGPGQVDARDMQYRVRTRTYFNLASNGTTYLKMRAETGQGFNNSWNNTGGGLGPGQSSFYVKVLELGQRFGQYVEVQAGGLDFDSGAGSQHTYASDDAAMVGYRGLLTGSASTWRPEKLSLTMGYVGDFNQSNFFLRCHMGKLNYMQALTQKELGANGEISAEIDSISDVWFTREAVHWQKGWGRIFDDVMVEAVTRTNLNPSFGWSATIARDLGAARRSQALVIYSDMPQGLYEKYGLPILLNQGEISTGKRLSWGASHEISRNLRLELFAGRRLDNTPTLRWVGQFGISYQYADIVNHLLRR
jgi:hypothetical protein